MLKDFLDIIFVFFFCFAVGFFGTSWLLRGTKQTTRREPSERFVIIQLQRLRNEIHLYDSLRCNHRDEYDMEQLCLGLYTKVIAVRALEEAWNWRVS